MTDKEPSLWKREIQPYKSYHSDRKDALLYGSKQRTKVIRFGNLTPCVLLASWLRRNQQDKNTNFGLFYLRKRQIYLSNLSGGRDRFHRFQEEFSSSTKLLLNSEIKLKFKKYFGLFSSFRTFFTAFYRHRITKQINWGKKKIESYPKPKTDYYQPN